ncbi:energy transducer TonB [Ruegeria sp. HKCCD7255]|uniref:energy transducer TonB family protein n=1 Tax=Ruegeria sp. HKCCD7255 TaxID=2683004 RepID=UPI0014878FA8|nr:energy transducer TonB [Ruegeria sp. HKCCD7255]
MIRRSLFVAALAVALSLLAHLIGLSMTVSTEPNAPSGQSRTEAVELSNAFEDLAEPLSEPEEPEPEQPEQPDDEPEPPVEPPLEPEVPISEALVASQDPQADSFAPDTGSEDLVQPEAPEEVVEDPVEEVGGDDSEETAVTDVEPVFESPVGVPEGVEIQAETPEADALEADAPQELAALPPELIETALAAPLEGEAIDPDISVSPSEAPSEQIEPQETEAEDSVPDQGLVTSLRPRLPDRNARPAARGTLQGAQNFDSLRFPQQTIDSPLTSYRREGRDVFRQGQQGNRSGGRGPGNSDTTNYAGQVLVHLNRSPLVAVSTRGFAQVFFEINPDGSLAWVDVIDSSGAPDVIRAAKEQVRIAAPFPPPPSGRSRKLSFFYQIR